MPSAVSLWKPRFITLLISEEITAQLIYKIGLSQKDNIVSWYLTRSYTTNQTETNNFEFLRESKMKEYNLVAPINSYTDVEGTCPCPKINN